MLWPPHWSASARSSVSNDTIPDQDKVTLRRGSLPSRASRQTKTQRTFARGHGSAGHAGRRGNEQGGGEGLT